ncbi:MAG: hypothetical protein BJ554DRAFT_1366 [Olpidium bornovanus]|uniref:Uncharacterized protein n=1 Tax=Olpidium bornovanus TaxID=278681 RepID=A0A8H7ZRX3_9FUNG|nr:MAG: hypothetical protein BJ554DRAFT_1366 [Olpidium bornovanus]
MGTSWLLLLLAVLLFACPGHAPVFPAVAAANETAPQEGEVCSYRQVTYPSVSAARAANDSIMHCGPCGRCSNPIDASVYRRQSKSLTQTTKRCAILLTVFGRAAGSYCVRQRTDFSPSCVDCWLDDMVCARKYCLLTCLTARPVERQTPGENLCIKCDEVICGPDFKKCSGANRRRLGVKSDIDRNSQEFCNVVDPPPVEFAQFFEPLQTSKTSA